MTTAGGLVFIGATMDKYLRAFDSRTGKEIWRHRVPFAIGSTPMTYQLRKNGKQFVVVAAGGHAGSTPGDALVAFALKDE